MHPMIAVAGTLFVLGTGFILLYLIAKRHDEKEE